MKKESGKDRFGINMSLFCKEHEKLVRRRLEEGGDLKELLSYHKVKLQWLQHERLIHLLVTMLCSILLMFFLLMLQYSPSSLPVLLLVAIFLVLDGFYLAHYFMLENTVQRWYHLAEEIYFRSRGED